MQVYLEDDISNFKTRFLQLLCGYLEVEERNIGKLIYVNAKTKESLTFPGLPFYIPNPICSSEKATHTDELEIAKAIARESQTEGFLYGLNSEERKQSNDFLVHIVNDLKYDVKKLLPELNENLKFSTFINDKYSISICDLFCFSLLIADFNKEIDEVKLKYSNVSRWANYIENLYGISNVCKKIGLWFNLPFVPLFLDFTEFEKKDDKKENKKEDKKDDKKEGKKEEKKEDKKEEGDNKKKEKKEKNKKNEKKDDLHPMSKVDIRVGKVVSIEPNPEGDKLYNEEIDIGNGEIRKIASGLRGRVDINDLKDSLVVVIANLKKRNLKGWPSHGMILCTSDKDGKVEPLRPPEGSQAGDLVMIGNLPREPATDKHCPWEDVCKKLFVNDKKEATYKDEKDEFVWHTEKGNIVSPTIANGTIS